MVVNIKEIENINETQVEILCKKIDPDVLFLEKYIQLFSKKLVTKQNGDNVLIHAKDVFYFSVI